MEVAVNKLIKSLKDEVIVVQKDLRELEELCEAVQDFDDDLKLPQQYGELFMFQHAAKTKGRVNSKAVQLGDSLVQLKKQISELENLDFNSEAGGAKIDDKK